MHTKEVCCDICPDPNAQWIVRIAADVTWAPGGDRSRSGVVILVLGTIVCWLSQKQSGTALAVHEAELNNAITDTEVWGFYEGTCFRYARTRVE